MRRPWILSALWFAWAACFQETGGGAGGDSTGGGCIEGAASCPCYANGTCDAQLACTMDVCVPPGCTAGEPACNCVDGQCLGALICDGGVCQEPAATTSASATMGTSEVGSDTQTSSTTDATTSGTDTVADSTTTVAPADLGGVACDPRSECGVCVGCAVNGPCDPEFETCKDEPECWALYQYVGACMFGDPVCIDQCHTDHPAGTATYQLLTACVDCECMMPCGTTPERCA